MKLFKSGHWILSVFPTYFVVQMKDCALATGLWQHRIVKHIHRPEEKGALETGWGAKPRWGCCLPVPWLQASWGPLGLGGSKKLVPSKGHGSALEGPTLNLCLRVFYLFFLQEKILGEYFSKIFINFPSVFLIC